MRPDPGVHGWRAAARSHRFEAGRPTLLRSAKPPRKLYGMSGAAISTRASWRSRNVANRRLQGSCGPSSSSSADPPPLTAEKILNQMTSPRRPRPSPYASVRHFGSVHTPLPALPALKDSSSLSPPPSLNPFESLPPVWDPQVGHERRRCRCRTCLNASRSECRPCKGAGASRTTHR